MTTPNQPGESGAPRGPGRPGRPGAPRRQGPRWRAAFISNPSRDEPCQVADAVLSLRIRDRDVSTGDAEPVSIALELVSTRVSGSYRAISSSSAFERFQESVTSFLLQDIPSASFEAQSDLGAQSSRVLIELFRSDLFGNVRSRIVCDSELAAGATESLSTQFEVGEHDLRRFARSLQGIFKHSGNLAILRGSGLRLSSVFDASLE